MIDWIGFGRFQVTASCLPQSALLGDEEKQCRTLELNEVPPRVLTR